MGWRLCLLQPAPREVTGAIQQRSGVHYLFTWSAQVSWQRDGRVGTCYLSAIDRLAMHTMWQSGIYKYITIITLLPASLANALSTSPRSNPIPCYAHPNLLCLFAYFN